MAKKIEDLYNDHMQANSPDMDKLWAKIEQRIDEKEQGAPKQSEPQKPQITIKHSNFGRYVTVAACLVAVVAGMVLFMKTSKNEVEPDVSSAADMAVSSQDESPKKAEGADRNKNDKQAINWENNDSGTRGDTESAAVAEENNKSNESAAEAESPKDRIKALMKGNEYLGADSEGRIKLIEKLAQEMKAAGEIKSFELKRRETNNRIEMTMPDETVVGLIIK